MKTVILTLLTIGVITQIGFSQNFDKAKLDNYFKTLEESNKFMGSVAVSKNGTILYSKSIGYSDIANKTVANENSKYRIGSISKTFTAVLVLKAVEEEKLNLSQTIDKYFPTIPNANLITIKHLIGHRSGIHNFTDDSTYMTWFTQPKTEKEMVEIIANSGSDFQPDSKAAYSNSNFVLLTYILEKTFQKPYSELIQAYITKPIGLTNTYFGGKINSSNNECQSYSFTGKWQIEPETDISVPMGAGGIVSTASDLTKFADALFGGKLLKAESLELMRTTKEGYGNGLFKMPFYTSIGYGHTGGIDGFSSVFIHFSSDDKISFALTSNASNYDNNNIAIAVLSAVYGKPYEIPVFSNYTVNSDELDKYLGVYSSKEMPLKITITKDNTTLVAQATGQSSFHLEATEKDKFKFDQAGVVLEFNPKEKTMVLKQGGGEYTFTKE